MKKLLNTLYVTSEGAHLRKEGETVAVDIDGANRARVPAHLLGQIVCFGQVTTSPSLMAFCAEGGVSISFLSYSGKFMARVEGPQTGNVLLRRAQHVATGNEAVAITVAQSIVAAKLSNQRALLRRHLRDYPETNGAAIVEEAQRRIADAARLALVASDLDVLRGREGEGALAYWTAFPFLIRNEDPAFAFAGRNRRPPRDAVNATLSFLYVLLGLDCRAAAEVHGLDPQMGFLHRDRPGRMSLALDLMEEFRAPVADRVCLSLVNRRQLSASDFRTEPTGAVLLSESGRDAVLKAFQERKRITLRHPFLDETMSLGLMPQVQAQMLARHLRGDIDGYPSYLWS